MPTLAITFKMFKLNKLFLLLLLSISAEITQCARILGIFNCPSKSLHLVGVTMAEILTERGHNFTLVSPYQITPPPQNFKHIFLSDLSKIIEGNINLDDFNISPYLAAFKYDQFGVSIANATFRDSNFKKLLKSKQKFDLIIMEIVLNESLMYLAEYYGVPLILYTSMEAGYWSNPRVGNSAPPSFVPHLLSHHTQYMTFSERLANSLMYLQTYLIGHFSSFPAQDKIVKENFPGAPDISEYYNKASIVLVNSDTSVSPAIPKVPAMIDIGGFHIRPPKPLPKDLEDVLSNSKNGVIYVSMGSNLKSSTMPKESLRTMLNAFSKLNETILWKWEDDQLPGKPDNVVLRKWLPQNDVLAHRNVKLFVSHAGFHSLLETIYHGVPCVLMPVFLDQVPNAKKATELGYAEWLKFEDITPNKFEWALQQLLNNPRYTEVAKKRSRILRDKPISQEDLMAFWVDYVIRHNGADHLKVSSLKLSWYEYILLDVIVFIIMCSISFVIVVKYLMKLAISKLRSNKLKKKIT